MSGIYLPPLYFLQNDSIIISIIKTSTPGSSARTGSRRVSEPGYVILIGLAMQSSQ